MRFILFFLLFIVLIMFLGTIILDEFPQLQPLFDEPLQFINCQIRYSGNTSLYHSHHRSDWHVKEDVKRSGMVFEKKEDGQEKTGERRR